MAIGFPAGITEAYIVNNAQAKLEAFRDALLDCEQFYLDMIAPYAVTDFEAAPISMDSVSAAAIFSAFSDMNAVYQLWTTGLPPGSYPQPPSAYIYATSARVIIGPLS